MGVRDDRLRAEYKSMRRFRSRTVSWKTLGENSPPDLYVFSYLLRSIIGFEDGEPRYYAGFKVQVRCPADFPRGKPIAHFANRPWPYHPNIWTDGQIDFDIGRRWIRGVGIALDTICQIIGEIIAFQRYDLTDLCNADPILTHWIKSSASRLPVDPSVIRLPDIEDAIRWGDNLESADDRG